MIILAAGASTRMGRPKQLIQFRGKTLLRRAAETARDADCSPILAVLGSEIEACTRELADLPVTRIPNPDWPKGMGTSLRAGVTALQRAAPETQAALILLCDQPLITAPDLRTLITAHEQTHKPVCAAAFDNTLGPPCLFASTYLTKLLTLPDDTGAKPLLRAAGNDLHTVAIPNAAIDVDTPNDLLHLNDPHPNI